MHPDALGAGPVKIFFPVVVHKQAAVDAQTQVFADHFKGPQGIVSPQQIVAAAFGGRDHIKLSGHIADLRRVGPLDAGIFAYITLIGKIHHIPADPAFDAGAVAMAGAVQVILPIEPHQKRIADFLPVPQIGQGTGVGIVTGHAFHLVKH